MRGYEYETNGYHRAVENEYEDEYYDEDEYEEDGSGAEGYVEEEEPPEGQKEILELRERLKEQIRRKAKAAGASAVGRSSSSHDRIPATRDNRFGSFFGPSKPVISQRVIEERNSLKELASTISRAPRPSVRDTPSTSKVQSKGNGHQHKPKIVNEIKRKAEALKDNRDYSFLLSDDADPSSSPKEKPAARSSLTQKSDREMMHSALKNKAPAGQPARLSNGYGSKNTSSTQRHAEGKVDSMRKGSSNRERAVSHDSERIPVRNGSNQVNISKTTSQKLPSKGPIANTHPSKDVSDPSLRRSSVASRNHFSETERPQSSQSQRIQSAGQRPQHSSHGQRPNQPVQQRQQQSLQSRRPQQVSPGQRPQQSLQSQRTQQSLHSERPQQPSTVKKLQSSQIHRPQSQSYRPQPLQGQRPLSSHGQHLEQRRVIANDRAKQVERQIRPPSKPMSSRQISSNGIRDDHSKKKQVAKRRFDEDEDEDALAMIRSMFRYDPTKYAGRDDDDSDMEADFATIEMEEKRSARIARQEDEEQLRLIEEEERREQERKRRKMARGR
ncbi:hypothetical protein ACP70R_011178 [Stipagrostis hirtigluma subsp. patula]